MGTFAGVCSCRRCPDSFLNFTRIILNTQSSVLTPKPQELDFKQGFTKLRKCISSRQRVPVPVQGEAESGADSHVQQGALHTTGRKANPTIPQS